MNSISEFRRKEIINIRDGRRYGYAVDVTVDLNSGRLTALVVPGRPRFFGLFGHEKDLVIGWEFIHHIGEDIILVDGSFEEIHPEQRHEFRH